jgi:hypothetical protein
LPLCHSQWGQLWNVCLDEVRQKKACHSKTSLEALCSDLWLAIGGTGEKGRDYEEAEFPHPHLYPFCHHGPIYKVPKK